MKKITIYDLIPLLKKGWVAMDRDGNWWWTKYKPRCRTTFGEWVSDYMAHTFYHESLYPFNIVPFDGDWKQSLIRVGVKTKKKKEKFLDDLTDSELQSWSEAYN